MMQKKVKVLIYVFLVLWLHLPLFAGDEGYDVYVDEIMRSVARQMEKELHLVWTGDSGMMHEQVEEIGMKFNAYRRATIEEARALELHVINKLVQAINSHEKIQPYLEERPFTYKRVQVSISFKGENGSYSDGTVAHVSNAPDFAVIENRNKLFYDSNDPLDQNYDMEIHSEHYEEAERLVKASPRQDLLVHHTTEQEKAIDQLLINFTEEMWETCGLSRWSIGGKMTHGIEEIGAKFTAFYPATQESARELQVFATEKLLKAINNNEKLKPFLKEYPFPASRIKMRICFRDKKYLNYSDGSMESIAFDGNEITYYHDLIIPRKTVEPKYFPVRTEVLAKETYSEALKVVQNIPQSKRKFKSKTI